MFQEAKQAMFIKIRIPEIIISHQPPTHGIIKGVIKEKKEMLEKKEKKEMTEQTGQMGKRG